EYRSEHYLELASLMDAVPRLLQLPIAEEEQRVHGVVDDDYAYGDGRVGAGLFLLQLRALAAAGGPAAPAPSSPSGAPLDYRLLAAGEAVPPGRTAVELGAFGLRAVPYRAALRAAELRVRSPVALDAPLALPFRFRPWGYPEGLHPRPRVWNQLL